MGENDVRVFCMLRTPPPSYYGQPVHSTDKMEQGVWQPWDMGTQRFSTRAFETEVGTHSHVM
jgi:hypothetical protein